MTELRLDQRQQSLHGVDNFTLYNDINIEIIKQCVRVPEFGLDLAHLPGYPCKFFMKVPNL